MVIGNYKIEAMRMLVVLFCLLGSLMLSGQSGKLTIHGRVENNNRTLSLVDYEIYKNNEVYQKGQTQKNGNFKIELDLGYIYSVAFHKEGYIDKSVAIIGKSDSTINGKFFFQLDLELFKVGEETEDETMLPPVAKLYISKEDEGFRFDKKYVNWSSEEYKEEVE